MRLSLIYIEIFLIISLSGSLGNNDTDKYKGVQNQELLKYYEVEHKTVSEFPAQVSTPILSFDSNGGGSNFMAVNYYSSPEDLVKIRKFTSPINKSGYLLNDGLLISVEISCKRDNVDTVNVSEIIDDDLYVEEQSIYCQKLDNLSEIVAYKKGLFEDPFNTKQHNILLHRKINDSEIKIGIDNNTKLLGIINISGAIEVNSTPIQHLLNKLSTDFNIYWIDSLDNLSYNDSTNFCNISIFNKSTSQFINFSLDIKNKEGTMSFSDGRDYRIWILKNNYNVELYDLWRSFNFDVTHINTDEVLAYKYIIKPKKRGIFYIDTIAKTYAKPFIESPMIIDISAKPKFEIYPIISDKEILTGEKVDLKYIIKYLGGNSQFFIPNIKIKLDEQPKSYIIKVEKEGPFNFSLYENKPYEAQLTFIKAGTYTIPGIRLNEEYQTFENRTINVKEYWEAPMELLLRYWVQIAFLITVISASMRIRVIHDPIALFLSFIRLEALHSKEGKLIQSIYYKYKRIMINKLRQSKRGN
jgi:hypothetical protein